MSRYSVAFVLFVVFVLQTTMVSGAVGGSGESFVVIPKETPSATAATATTTTEALEKKKEIKCKKKPGSNEVVKVKLQVTGHNTKFKVLNLKGECDVAKNTVKAGVMVKVPSTFWSSWGSLASLFGGDKDKGNILKKLTKECKVTDKVVTFWLKEKSNEIKVICGKGKPGKPGDYRTNYNGQGAANQQTGQGDQRPAWTRQSAEQAAAGQQQQGQGMGAGSGTSQGSGGSPQQAYNDDYDRYQQEQEDRWRQDEERRRLEAAIGGGDAEATSDGDEFDDWDQDWDGEEFSEDETLYGAVGNDVVADLTDTIAQAQAGGGDAEYYYKDDDFFFEEGLGNPDDAIGSLLGGYDNGLSEAVFYTTEGAGEEVWGVLDSNFTELSVQELAEFTSYPEFKEYYAGNVNEEEWRDWREWFFAHNRSTWNVNFDNSFYDEYEVESVWYVRWWDSVKIWWQDTNPASGKFRNA